VTLYLTRGCFPDSADAELEGNPELRIEAVTELATALGIKLIDYELSAGERDFLLVTKTQRTEPLTDFAAAMLVAAATGGVTDLRTTMTIAVRTTDVVRAMGKAG
jgi:uncharacterized protein with GYD domain